MTSMIPCLKPFVAGLHTGYGAFDMKQVATQVNLSSNVPTNIALNSTTGPSSLVGGGGATLDGGLESPTTGHHGRPSQAIPVTRGIGLGLYPRVAGEGEASEVAQDGNSIGSNDSQQMIIHKVVN